MGILLFILGLAVIWYPHYPVKWFYDWVRRESNLPERDENDANVSVPHRIIGTFERLLAFTLVAGNVEAAYTILLAWMAAKLAANWQRRPDAEGDLTSRDVRAATLVALMTGALSLAFGVLGGTIARCAF